MKKSFSLLVAGSLGIFLTATAVVRARQPPAETVIRQVVLPVVNALRINTETDITVQEGSPQEIEVTGPAHLLDQTHMGVRNGVLVLRSPEGLGRWLLGRGPAPRLHLRLTLPALRQVSLAGTCTLTSLTPLTAPTLTVVLSGASHARLQVENRQVSVVLTGASTATLRGSTTRQQVQLTGTGTYHAFDLQSATTMAYLAGMGTEEVTAQDSLTAHITGIGTIRYRGNPTALVTTISGLGEIKADQ